MANRFFILCVLALLGLSAARAWADDAWPTPDADKLAAGPWKDAVIYGRRLITDTPSLIGPEVPNAKMRYAGNNLTCESCHLHAGTQKFALPLIGIYGVFPTYMGRENEIRSLEDRVNGCMERSLNGRVLPVDGKEMRAIVAYLKFVSEGIAVGTSIKGRSTPPLPLLPRAAHPQHGSKVYADICAACHQADGQGQRVGMKGDAKGYVFPPLWGPDSFNDGAGMHRLMASASFIHADMPFGVTADAPTLSVEDAWDVAAYINTQQRPHRSGLDRDYPDRSRKPVDAPFPPFADSFPAQQHQLGPFQPMLTAR